VRSEGTSLKLENVSRPYHEMRPRITLIPELGASWTPTEHCVTRFSSQQVHNYKISSIFRLVYKLFVLTFKRKPTIYSRNVIIEVAGL
jgi:hypothetical protein